MEKIITNATDCKEFLEYLISHRDEIKEKVVEIIKDRVDIWWTEDIYVDDLLVYEGCDIYDSETYMESIVHTSWYNNEYESDELHPSMEILEVLPDEKQMEIANEMMWDIHHPESYPETKVDEAIDEYIGRNGGEDMLEYMDRYTIDYRHTYNFHVNPYSIRNNGGIVKTVKTIEECRKIIKEDKQIVDRLLRKMPYAMQRYAERCMDFAYETREEISDEYGCCLPRVKDKYDNQDYYYSYVSWAFHLTDRKICEAAPNYFVDGLLEEFRNAIEEECDLGQFEGLYERFTEEELW